jgi:hypothetical protein
MNKLSFKEAIAKAEEQGGITWDLFTGLEYTSGDAMKTGKIFAVSVAREHRVSNLGPEEVMHYASLFNQWQAKDHFIGLWKDGDEWCIDVTMVTSSLNEAKLIGRANKQKSIFDFQTGRVYDLHDID